LEPQKCVNGKCVQDDICNPKCLKPQKCVNGKCGAYYCVVNDDNSEVCRFYSGNKNDYKFRFGPFTDDKCGNNCNNYCGDCKPGTICLANNKKCVKCDNIDLTIDNLVNNSEFGLSYAKQGTEPTNKKNTNPERVVYHEDKDTSFFLLTGGSGGDKLWNITRNEDKTFNIITNQCSSDGKCTTYKNFKKYDNYTFKSDPSYEDYCMYLRLIACDTN
jgi:hypothetical protein